MKFLIAITFALFIVDTAQAATYECRGLTEDISVIIHELKDVTNEVSFGSHYDYVYRVKVDIVKADGSTQSFFNYATAIDVEYHISAVKKEGVSIYLFLDEADQAGITFTGENGNKKTIRLVCE